LETSTKTKLVSLLGSYPNTLPIKQGEVPSEFIEFEFADFKVANHGFKPLVREARFDLGELAIVTFLQAKAYQKPYVLMPVPVVARSQHHTLAYNPERGELTPAGLAGKKVGIRAYSVTTGVWVRGVLARQFGLNLDKVHWVTFEDPHVAEYADPDFVERAPVGKDVTRMLLDGELDAAVVGDKLPDPKLKILIPDSEGAARTWAEQHGTPINHMLVVRSELSRARPDIVREVFRIFKASRDIAIRNGNKNAEQLRFGLAPNRRSLEAIIDIAHSQRLIPRRFEADELFDANTIDLT
jgi:4,5-dihydroxyphthalate decarboxylase